MGDAETIRGQCRPQQQGDAVHILAT
jgi:hypothetical protein